MKIRTNDTIEASGKLFINNSSISQYAKCPTLWVYEMGKDRTNSVGDTPALQRGSLLHDALADAFSALHKGTDVKGCYELGLESANALLDKYPMGETGVDMYMSYAPVLLESGYIPVGVDKQGVTIPAIELPFQVDIDDYLDSPFLKRFFKPKERKAVRESIQAALGDMDVDVIFRGTIDAVLTDKTGYTSIVDWKTRGRIYSQTDVIYDRQLWFYYTMFSIAYPDLEVESVKQVQLLSKTPQTEVQLTQKSAISKRATYLQHTVDNYIASNDVSPSDVAALQGQVKPYSFYIDTLEVKPNHRMIREQLKSVHDWTIEMIRAYRTKNFRRINNAYMCGGCLHKSVCFNSF